MSLLGEMHPNWQIGSYEAFEDLRRLLAEAIRRGYVEEVPVMNKHPMLSVQNWYRDKQTGDVYCLVPPDFPAQGSWIKVDLEDLKKSDHPVQ